MITTGRTESTTDRGARLARATVVLLRHALTCDRTHQWQMARVMWQKQADAYRELKAHNDIATLRKNTGERWY
jgi:hypothetical protein